DIFLRDNIGTIAMYGCRSDVVPFFVLCRASVLTILWNSWTPGMLDQCPVSEMRMGRVVCRFNWDCFGFRIVLVHVVDLVSGLRRCMAWEAKVPVTNR
ncbi:MAG: hypothetical protein ACK58L_19745, partial [Planctomycetota bacterium]